MKYYYCYNVKSGLFDMEIKQAKKLGIYIFYDEVEDVFYDSKNHQIDIKDLKIFPRSNISRSKKLVAAIIKHGGISIVDNTSFDTTLDWPYYIKTKRKNLILSGKQILDNPQMIIDIFGNNKIFFKTKQKNFSQIIDVTHITNKNYAFSEALKKHLEDDFIISEAVSIESDEHVLLEYRAFVVEGELFNISRVSHYLLEKLPEEILIKIEHIISSLKQTDFPSSYTIDVFVYKDKKGNQMIDVLECNPIIASGTYLYNSVIEKTPDPVHQCPSNSIPKEKTIYGPVEKYNYHAIEKNRLSSIFYHLRGGFAYDLTQISLFGNQLEEELILQDTPVIRRVLK